MTPAPRRQQGFTLVELIVAILIAGILVAIALPSYGQYVVRTKRTVAKTALAEVITRQESYATDHKRYAPDFGRLGIGSAGATAYVKSDGTLSDSTTDAIYTLTLTETGTAGTCSGTGAATARSYRINAEPRPATGDAQCGTICLTSNGDRGSSVSGAAADCWRR